MALPNRIDVRVMNLRRREALAAAAITPGDLIEITTANAVQVHSAAGGPAAKSFALACLMSGKSIDAAYAEDDTVEYMQAQPGDEVLARLAISQTIIVGDKLISAGNGQLKKYVPLTDADINPTVLAIAAEALTTDGSTIGRLIVEIV